MKFSPILTQTSQDEAKLAAGRFAAHNLIENGLKVGLGSGTTSHYFVRALAERFHEEKLDISCAVTSRSTFELAKSLGLPLYELDELGDLDICIDGPDEIARDGSMIKGGGACLLWEKLVADNSTEVVIVSDESKMVSQLGRFPLPIEVVQFAWRTTVSSIQQLLREFGYDERTISRRVSNGEPVITDNNNYIVDAFLDHVIDPKGLTVQLNQIPGVVENGLFIDVADKVIFGKPDGTASMRSLPLD